MSLPYKKLNNITSSLNGGYYVTPEDFDLFVGESSLDYWYGMSERDVVEFSVFDKQENQYLWECIFPKKIYKENYLSTLNEKNETIQYSYKEFISDFILYKNDKILDQVSKTMSERSIPTGNYILSYNFVRNMAGDEKNPIYIKEISPSKKEIKITTKQKSIPFDAFCLKKFQISDVAPLVLKSLYDFPYNKIYTSLKEQNKETIDFIKFLFFIKNDGEFLTFLKSFYEDYIKYTALSEESVSAGLTSDLLIRIQGIRTYFSNHLLYNYNTISDFPELKSYYEKFVTNRISDKFSQFKNQTDVKYKDAEKLLFDIFTKYFYDKVVGELENVFIKKYFSPFKNCLNLGNNQFFPIINQSFIDERKNEEDSLTLLIKLADELPQSVKIKDKCWISNISIIPSLINVVFKNYIQQKTYKISGPDFNQKNILTNQQNNNKVYSETSLKEELSGYKNLIKINKDIKNLPLDYSNFSDFINFSSAENRIILFKNKIINLTNLNESLSILEENYSSSISNGSIYQYYNEEKEDIQNNINSIFESFDGYESYLYKSGKFIYDIDRVSFLNPSYVYSLDEAARLYDKNNRDSFINNTPSYILTNDENSDYLIFLSMIGHYFDNIYNYIKCLPSEKHPSQNSEDNFTKNIIEEMLRSFGWAIESDFENFSEKDFYLQTDNSSQEDSIKQIKNRILNSLPAIYKTKGVDECVKTILSCYGIPTSLISIKEFGTSASTKSDSPSYSSDERIYLMRYTKNNEFVKVPYKSDVKTLEFSFSTDGDYQVNEKIPILAKLDNDDVKNWEMGFIKEPKKYHGKVYVKFEASQSLEQNTIYTESFPLFNGTIYSLMLRKNSPSDYFEYFSDENYVPILYDLFVKSNESGRTVFFSTGSKLLSKEYNQKFSSIGNLYFGNYEQNKFSGCLDKILIWNKPITDLQFNDHVNNINSYSSYDDSSIDKIDESYKSLYFRMNYEYPEDLQTASIIKNSSEFYSSSISASAVNFPMISFSSSICPKNITPIYPYQFKPFNINQTWNVNNFGPNRFKNLKIKNETRVLSTRLDHLLTSTYKSEQYYSDESNQLGFFLDTQDYKNKDILRYLGNVNLMEFVADPENLTKQKYEKLNILRNSFDKSGNKITLFNELINLYRFYFNPSIFDSIKNIVPARSNFSAGVLIEPTVLERPKYENKPISSIAEGAQYMSSTIKNIYKAEKSISSGDFNIDLDLLSEPQKTSIENSLPKNLYSTIDLSNIFDENKIYSKNINFGNIQDISDKIQNGMFCYPKNSNTLGKTYDNFILTPNTMPESGSVSYILKVWNKHYFYSKSEKETDSFSNNMYSSGSIYLYNLSLVSAEFYNSLIYTEDTWSYTDISEIYNAATFRWFHRKNTFKNTPNMTVNNIVVNSYNPIDYTITLKQLDVPSYFELFSNYPKNHISHKKLNFSNEKYGIKLGSEKSLYIKSKQTSDTTIGRDGITDGSSPVEITNTSNVNVVQKTNVID